MMAFLLIDASLPVHESDSQIQLTDRTPIVQPLLDFLHLRWLDCDFKVIQAVDVLRMHGKRVSNMDTFMLSIQPKLLPR
jgi:hypothetical protein